MAKRATTRYRDAASARDARQAPDDSPVVLQEFSKEPEGETTLRARTLETRSPNMNDDDSGDEAEARHLLAKRREQAKYDAVRTDSDRSVVETVAEPGLMDSLLRCLRQWTAPRRRGTLGSEPGPVCHPASRPYLYESYRRRQ